MYYRVAIRPTNESAWQWKSTILTSLATLFRFLQLYDAISQDRLRVFSSCSREQMDEMLARENSGLASRSVMAEQFLHERGISSRGMKLERAAAGTQEQQGMKPIAVTTSSSLSERSTGAHFLEEKSLSSLERRRLELEMGIGGDHDSPYSFSLPSSMPQALAWVKLLTKVQCGVLQP